ncbi:hypothetical protein FGE12_24860 [Aggregicoccus sp. 17bor-14]|uniref:hypothetical protein n=1 Tax=Myxococcaceae TaxID=31 RepID=UPI00129CE161|nr:MULTISPECIES: hypothetical protein [Myxococcaceae]MBF5045661.1 hypothetical protein [Simulacricoccus sp. 17bor-14]MRI91398.1 hypothetical protein [Aggregicoccus sp. 17bor-14]
MISCRPVLLACAVAALLVPAAAHPQTVVNATFNTAYVFETVDSYEVKGWPNRVVVTGLQVGASDPTTISFPYYTSNATSTETARSFERCDRFALIAMNKPGQFLLEVRTEGSSSSFPFVACKLTRR